MDWSVPICVVLIGSAGLALAYQWRVQRQRDSVRRARRFRRKAYAHAFAWVYGGQKLRRLAYHPPAPVEPATERPDPEEPPPPPPGGRPKARFAPRPKLPSRKRPPRQRRSPQRRAPRR